MKTAIIVGASSGLGRHVAKLLVRDGYRVGLVARREEMLESLRQELGENALVQPADVTKPENIQRAIRGLIDQMGTVHLIVLASAVSHWNPELEWDSQAVEIDTNARGFAAAATVAMEHFTSVGSGHLVGISSVAGIRGNGNLASYCATKAFVSNYMAGLRHLSALRRLPIRITEIQPGFMDSGTAKGKVFWSVSLEKAAEQTLRAIRRGTKHAYITPRWRLIALFMRCAPDFLWHRCA